MKFKLPRLCLVLALIVLTGCQAMMYGTASDLNKISVGMTKEQVIETLGQPTSSAADSGKSEEYLTYFKMPQTLGWLPKNYLVTLREGKVVRFGEKPKDAP